MNKNRIFKVVAIINFIVLIGVFLMYKNGNSIFNRNKTEYSGIKVGQNEPMNSDSTSKNKENGRSTGSTHPGSDVINDTINHQEAKMEINDDNTRLSSSKSILPSHYSSVKKDLKDDNKKQNTSQGKNAQ